MRDQALEIAFARGEATAFDEVYRRFLPRLHAGASRLLQDPQLAQDCVHDVLFRLWKRGDAYAPERGSLEAFLVVCVRNEALMRMRNSARQDQLRAKLRPAREYTMETDPIERGRIARAIAKLTPLQAQMVEYAYFRAMTLAEIAAELGKPLGTIKSHISAALRSLRAALREEGADRA
ncbi:MAG: sigma-70 family RNA polymerase sigma factor [Candidatus Baltobacteraceae bacterium]